MEKKITKIEAVEKAIALMKETNEAEYVECIEKLLGMKEQLQKKNLGGSKEKAKANNELMELIKNYMSYDTPLRIMDIYFKGQEEFIALGVSQNKLSAMIKKMKDNKEVERIEEKKIAYFKLRKTE